MTITRYGLKEFFRAIENLHQQKNQNQRRVTLKTCAAIASCIKRRTSNILHQYLNSKRMMNE